MQSVQKLLAENLERSTVGMPSTNAAPVPTTPPAVWYSGNELYTRSDERKPNMCTVAAVTSKYLETKITWGRIYNDSVVVMCYQYLRSNEKKEKKLLILFCGEIRNFTNTELVILINKYAFLKGVEWGCTEIN